MNIAFEMRPEGSLNKLTISSSLLHEEDPLPRNVKMCGFDLMSRQALITLLTSLKHPHQNSPRLFIEHFDANNPLDQHALQLLAHRFTAVIESAKSNKHWIILNEHTAKLTQYWRDTRSIILSGGLTTGEFGIAFADQVESLFNDRISVIASPWGGTTALYGLAQTASRKEAILVMDFGGTGIKRAIATQYGHHLTHLPNLHVAPYKKDNLIHKDNLLSILAQTRAELPDNLPIAISIACYMKNGHPFNYHSGIYHRLFSESNHLYHDLNNNWLPKLNLGPLLLLEHDSTAAALAFHTKHTAMMVTLGTGMGSAPCPIASPSTTPPIE